jgi:phosphoglycerate dehydrogenase-like enzyme
MNRRTFLTASTASAVAASLTTTAPASVQSTTKRLKVILSETPAELLARLQAAAPGAELVQCRDEAEAIERVTDADACYGFITPKVIRAGKSLKWVQQGSAGVETLMEIPELVQGDIILTNMQRAYGPEIADQAIAYLLAFTRCLTHYVRVQPSQEWSRSEPGLVFDELMGKTMLIIGLGGIGTEIARRAFGFGMRVLATDPKVLERPLYVEELHKPSAFHKLLPRADVLASAVPLTKESRKMIGAREFGMMKQGSILINVSRGKVVDTEALISALDSKQIAAAGLDVTDPEPLTKGHPLWSRNVIITPHSAGQSAGGLKRRDDILVENLRRFAAGEMLLNVVDKKVGY